MMASLSFCIFFRWQLYLSILSSFLLGELSYFSYLLSNHYILSSTFSYNKLNYSITNLLKFYLYSWKCNQLIFDLEPIQATYTYSSLLYMTASFPLYMFRWQFWMLILLFWAFIFIQHLLMFSSTSSNNKIYFFTSSLQIFIQISLYEKVINLI